MKLIFLSNKMQNAKLSLIHFELRNIKTNITIL